LGITTRKGKKHQEKISKKVIIIAYNWVQEMG